MNIDWSKAPEDATHAGATKGILTPVFYKDIQENKYSYWFDDEGGWREDAEGHPSRTPVIERPKKQEAWDGEGLPPVDCLCETFDVDASCWIKVEIYAHTELMGETNVCAKNGTDMFYGLAREFRPIKTAEQLAEEERSATIQDIRDIANGALDRGITWAEAIYLAGYRKQ